jgi:FtsH-binding integral membrane protein
MGMTLLGMIALFAPLGLVLFISFRINRMSVPAAQATFWGYAALVGIGVAPILLVYTGASVAQVFFITAATFGAMSLWGYTTKANLASFGSFLFMGLIGVVIASLVNLFLASPGLQFAISVIGVIVFTGLTAWDTQQIKEMYWAGDGAVVAGKKSVMGALRLYLDFLNLFLMMLQFMGVRRN